jgi:hypothetical protein
MIRFAVMVRHYDSTRCHLYSDGRYNTAVDEFESVPKTLWVVAKACAGWLRGGGDSL